MTTPLVGTDGSIDFWFVHLHGDHGFVSNGLRYSSLEEAQDFATGALKRNPAFCGAEIIPRVGERIKILAKDVSCVSTRESYQQGLSLGYEYADADHHEWASFATGEAELRAEVLEAREDSPSWRAYKLGIVRAYRDVVRTLRDGRWGT